jgi:hypothetical protein
MKEPVRAGRLMAGRFKKGAGSQPQIERIELSRAPGTANEFMSAGTASRLRTLLTTKPKLTYVR